jgi:signal transduction histidine kinase
MKTTTMRAALIAGTYLGLAGAWIMGSGWLARSIASSVEELERLERWKGMGFVLVTGLGLFFVAWSALRKQHADAEDAARAREALLKSERKAMAGLFVSSIAHDASNLTFVVTSALELLNRDPELSQDDRACVEDASAAMSQLITLFKDLKQMGGNRNPSLRVQIDLGEAARRAVKLLKGHSLMKHARVVVDAPTKIDLLAFPVLIDQLLINLLLNAADATGGRGHLEVRLRSDEKEARLEVHDDGAGLPPGMEAQLFTPFATTKPNGTGLGLVSVKECARAHGGRVEYAKSPLGGAAFSVVLPLITP